MLKNRMVTVGMLVTVAVTLIGWDIYVYYTPLQKKATPLAAYCWASLNGTPSARSHLAS